MSDHIEIEGQPGTVTQGVDVVVLGSGAAGLVAAIAAADSGASVALVEKSDLIGGTTAMSGGIIWMPVNHLQAPAGIEDSREQALAYLEALSLGKIDSDMAATLVDTGPEALRYLAERTPCSFHLIRGYPDYHPEHPGGLPGGGRSLDNGLFSYNELGDWAARVRNDRGAHPIMLTETPLGGASQMPPTDVLVARAKRSEFGMGLALTGALLRGLLDRGVEPMLGAPAARLITVDPAGDPTGRRADGAAAAPGEHGAGDGDAKVSVRGVELADGRMISAGAVIIATGGFEWNPELTAAFLRGPMTAPAGAPTNTGDGLTMAMEAGARLGNMSSAWWVPVVRVPGEESFGHPRVRLILLERTRPGSIMVNSAGTRFTNEAGNYNAMGGAFHTFDPSGFTYPNLPCWLVFDHRHKLSYDVAGAPPGPDAPDWMNRAETLDELAAAIGVPAPALGATVARFNADAAQGRDTEFGRGDSAYDTFNGDQRIAGVGATLGPLETAPYYATEIELGTLGTNGGPKTDTRCRVLANAGGVIGGLYAAGNAMAAPTGMLYGGAGGTLGPAITTGFIAGRDAARTVTAGR
ncbi:FAD-dependent oxidoreductase [Candidatus Poriferisodalis sp.]|uniref:FAD-dependent oxidoreductase n=1 Tax=Candidatus Poriferisodalis sp. TaxID=3101277 RepID=UPI003B02AD36